MNLVKRMHHDISAIVDRARDVRSSEGVVDHQRNAVFVRDLGDRLDIEHIAARIADRFAIEQLGLGRDGLAEIFGIVRLDEHEIVAEPAHGDIELRECAAVQGAGRNDLIARARQSS